MPELRWILIGFGVVLLVGIYAWGRRGNKQSVASGEAPVRSRPEPRLSSHEAESDAFDRPLDPLDEAIDEAEEADEFRDPAPAAASSITALRQAPRDASDMAAVASSPSADFTRASSAVRRSRVEPTFNDDDGVVTEELPARESTAADSTTDAAADSGAPTLAMSDTPQPRRIERRKIIALRLAAASDRFAGQQLREALEADSLQHGKYDVFHRLHDDGTSVFSVASMVEPGTFDLHQMNTVRYPGITLFAQLPGPVEGVEALHELVACGKRLQQSLGGTLQDERGVPLTMHRIERLRQEIQDFENAPGRESAQRHSISPPSP